MMSAVLALQELPLALRHLDFLVRVQLVYGVLAENILPHRRVQRSPEAEMCIRDSDKPDAPLVEKGRPKMDSKTHNLFVQYRKNPTEANLSLIHI